MCDLTYSIFHAAVDNKYMRPTTTEHRFERTTAEPCQAPSLYRLTAPHLKKVLVVGDTHGTHAILVPPLLEVALISTPASKRGQQDECT
jgi:hypothetical protein